MCLCSHVQKFVDEVTKCGRLGICFGVIEIRDCFPGGNAFENNEQCDRFKIDIPYCLSKITCNVIFHADHPEFAPDLILADNSFSAQLQDLTSLCHWESDGGRGLLHVLRELFHLYKRQQAQNLEGFSRLHFEYSSVTNLEGFSENDVEVLMIDKNAEGPVQFLIRLPVDFSQIPAVITTDNPGEDTALLLVTFQNAEGSRCTPQLFLSPGVENALCGSQPVRVPGLPPDLCLIDYVPSVVNLLQNKVDTAVKSYNKRQEYVAAFLSHFGRSVIEYDVYSYSHISLLYEWNDFFFILNIRLSIAFPEEQPVFVFQSVYHTTSGKPFTDKVADYPYSPRWNANEMAERSRIYVLDYVPQFQENSMANRNG